MYLSSNSSAGSGFHVEPDRLDRQAADVAKLGDGLRQGIGQRSVESAALGTSPPAEWFAARLANLTGQGGVSGALLEWADGLESLSQTQRATAADYRTTDDQNSVTFKEIHSGSGRPEAQILRSPENLNLPQEMENT